MADDVRIVGAEKFKSLSHRLKAAGSQGKELKRELNKAVDEAAQPLVDEVQQAERTDLPRRGGLADLVAGQKIRVSKTVNGVRLVQAGRSLQTLKQMDSGRLRHPVYGHNVWVTQQIKPGFWSETLSSSKNTAAVRARIMRAMHDVAKKIED